MPKSLIIIEADPTLANNLENALKDDFEINIALNGSDGLNTIVEQKPNVAIIDFFLPELNGFQICTQLKQKQLLADINIILLVDSEDIGNRFVNQFGIKKYFLKPYNIDEIANFIRTFTAEADVEEAASNVEDLKFDDDESLKLLDDIFSDMGLEDGAQQEPELPMVEESAPSDDKTEIIEGEGQEEGSSGDDLLGDLEETLESLQIEEDEPKSEETPPQEERAEELTEEIEIPEIPEMEEVAVEELTEDIEIPEIPDIEETPVEEPPAEPAEELTEDVEIPEIPDIEETPVEEHPAEPAEELTEDFEIPEMPDIEETPVEEPPAVPVEEMFEETPQEEPAEVKEEIQFPEGEESTDKTEETIEEEIEFPDIPESEEIIEEVPQEEPAEEIANAPENIEEEIQEEIADTPSEESGFEEIEIEEIEVEEIDISAEEDAVKEGSIEEHIPEQVEETISEPETIQEESPLEGDVPKEIDEKPEQEIGAIEKFGFSGDIMEEKNLSLALGQMITNAIEKQIVIALEKIDFNGIINDMIEKTIQEEIGKNMDPDKIESIISDKVKDLVTQSKTDIEGQLDGLVKVKMTEVFKNIGSMFGGVSGK